MLLRGQYLSHVGGVTALLWRPISQILRGIDSYQVNQKIQLPSYPTIMLHVGKFGRLND
jgi:hypothetical protein